MNIVLGKLTAALFLISTLLFFSSFDDNITDAVAKSKNLTYDGADQVILVQEALKQSIYFHIDSDKITQAEVSKAQKALMQQIDALEPYVLDSMHLSQMEGIKQMSSEVGIYQLGDDFSVLNHSLSAEAFDFYQSIAQVDQPIQTVEHRVVNQLVLLNRLATYYGLSSLGVNVSEHQSKLNAMMRIVNINAERMVVETIDEDILKANTAFNEKWSAFYDKRAAVKNLEMSPLEVYNMTTEMSSELQIIKERYRATAPLYVFDSKRIK